MTPSFDIGPMDFPAYFTLLTVGFMAAIWLAWREAPGVGVDQNALLDTALVALVMGILGARGLHVLVDGYLQDYIHLCLDPLALEGRALPHGWKCPTDFVCQIWERGALCHPETGLCHPARDCLRPLKFWYGGLTYYGGFLSAFAACLWFVRRRRMPVWRVADLTGFAIALGLVFGRLGCFFAGCCFGKTWSGSLAVAFPRGGPAWRQHVDQSQMLQHFTRDLAPGSTWWNEIAALAHLPKSAAASWPVHATQLYEMLVNVFVFAACYWLFKKRRSYDGKVFWWFVLLYSVGRFITEAWRNDERGLWFGEALSTSQLIGIPLVLLALFMMWRGRRAAGAESSR